MLREAVQRITRVRPEIPIIHPTLGAGTEAHGHELDDGFEAFEGPHDVCAVRPGAAAVEVEDVAVFGRGEARAGG